MNRSLESLAILVICLVGTLAAVRMSTKDAAERTVARQPAVTPDKPAPASSSSSSITEPEQTLLSYGDRLAYQPEVAIPQYDSACGRDQQTGEVYRPLRPVLTAAEFAARVIRSEPLPLIVLPDSESLESARTGYDEAYDAAVFGEVVSSSELDYEQMEADYAAAELAAAEQAELQPASIGSALLRPAAIVIEITEQSQVCIDLAVANGRRFQQAYFPVYRGIYTRWTQQVSPHLRHFPRETSSARKSLLLRQQAGLDATPALNWNDYLSFAERELASRIEPKPPQVAREPETDELWLSR